MKTWYKPSLHWFYRSWRRESRLRCRHSPFRNRRDQVSMVTLTTVVQLLPQRQPQWELRQEQQSQPQKRPSWPAHLLLWIKAKRSLPPLRTILTCLQMRPWHLIQCVLWPSACSTMQATKKNQLASLGWAWQRFSDCICQRTSWLNISPLARSIALKREKDVVLRSINKVVANTCVLHFNLLCVSEFSFDRLRRPQRCKYQTLQRFKAQRRPHNPEQTTQHTHENLHNVAWKVRHESQIKEEWTYF